MSLEYRMHLNQVEVVFEEGDDRDELNRRAADHLGVDGYDLDGRYGTRYIARKVDLMGRAALVCLSQNRDMQGRPAWEGEVKVTVYTPGEFFGANGFYLYAHHRTFEAWQAAMTRAEGEGITDFAAIEQIAEEEARRGFEAWWDEMVARLNALPNCR